MKIFLSWSGERSKSIAQALREWLPLVLHYAAPWISEKDITSGDRWSLGMGKELEDAKFGIICLCDDNLLAPWILFEAGALSKSMTSASVCPLLFQVDTKDLPPPLSQFQAKKFDRNQMFELISDINKKVEQPVSQEVITQLFDALWPQLELKINTIPSGVVNVQNKPSQNEILEKLADNIQRVEYRIQEMMAKLFDYVEKNIQIQESQMHRIAESVARNEFIHVPVRDIPSEIDREFMVHRRNTPDRHVLQVKVRPDGIFKKIRGGYSFVAEPQNIINKITNYYRLDPNGLGRDWYLFLDGNGEPIEELTLIELAKLKRHLDVRLSDSSF